jgi:integrase
MFDLNLNLTSVKNYVLVGVAPETGPAVPRLPRSLSPSFSTLLKRTLRKNNGAGMPSVYAVLERELGKWPVDEGFQLHFDRFIDKLAEVGRAQNTIANYQSVVQKILNDAKDKRMISTIPIASFDIRREYRDRVWTPEERERLYRTLKAYRSHLFWSVYFSEKNPIRGRSDLWHLTRDDLVLKGMFAPYVRFRPQKTSKVKPRDTYLPEIDDALLNYWDWLKVMFPDCPYLFPRVFIRFKKYCWAPMGEPDKHWSYICGKAKVADFHFHDLKHVAISWMVHARNEDGSTRYTLQDLKDLGIQYSDEAIAVYLNLDAECVLSRLRGPKVDETGEKAGTFGVVKYA